MIRVNGKHNEAIIYTNNPDEKTIGQVIEICNQDVYKDNKIRIMPDCHYGAGCVIGTSMTLKNDVVAPALVGLDIGCGVKAVEISEKTIDFERLDRTIRDHVPFGASIRTEPFKKGLIDLSKLKCANAVDTYRAELSIGTLGSGNHYIEVNQDDVGSLYLTVHSGSRHLGKQVATFYQNLAYKRLTDRKEDVNRIILELKNQGREKDIEDALKRIPKIKIDKDMAYLTGDDFHDYIHDMHIVQRYAEINRDSILEDICKRMGFTVVNTIHSVHNYIDKKGVLRKGAISAEEREAVIIPINMRDGSLIGYGLGNPEWNYSAPHGAGRIMSRGEAKEKVDLEQYRESMKDVWTSCVGHGTIDEAPDAYKPIQDIIDNTKDTISIITLAKPLYNFKSSDEVEYVTKRD